MEFKYNFSQLIKHEEPSDKNKILHDEIILIYEGDARHTVWQPVTKYEVSGIYYYYLIGFSSKHHRFLQVLLKCEDETIYFLQVQVVQDLKIIIEDFFNKI